MAELHDFFVVDASNTARFPESQAPSTLNNGMRADEGIIARFFFDTNYSVVATLSGSCIQMTANRASITLTGTTSNYVNDLLMAFTMGSLPNIDGPLININGIGNISLRDSVGASLSANAIPSGAKVLITKDGTNNYFRLLTPAIATGRNTYSNFNVTNPATEGGATKVMKGLGALWALTPRFSGRVRIFITGYSTNSLLGNVKLNAAYGTGTAPVDGAALTGTLFYTNDILATSANSGASPAVPFSIIAEAKGLTINTAYWFDMCLGSSSGNSSLVALNVIIEEVRA